jgi:hypothetical protein
MSVRNKLVRELSDQKGIDSVGVTRVKGVFALCVQVEEASYHSVKLPKTFEGYPVIREKATEFVPH